MENLNIDQIIHLREEAIERLLAQKAQLQTELDTINGRLLEIDDQLHKLGFQTPRGFSSLKAVKIGQGKLYKYKAGQGFALIPTGELIGPGETEAEALQAIKSWCAKVGKTYYQTQWKRIINPNYGKS